MFHSLLNKHGYVVADLDYRGSKGYGRDWRTAIIAKMGTPEVEDLVDVADYLQRELNVDGDRLGTYGGSYGGFGLYGVVWNRVCLKPARHCVR